MEKCKKRGYRRDLTDRYHNRQVMLHANYYGWKVARNYTQNYRKQNSISCGIARCNMCMNDRRNPWHSNKMKLTMPERKQLEYNSSQLEYYYSQDCVDQEYENYTIEEFYND